MWKTTISQYVVWRLAFAWEGGLWLAVSGVDACASPVPDPMSWQLQRWFAGAETTLDNKQRSRSCTLAISMTAAGCMLLSQTGFSMGRLVLMSSLPPSRDTISNSHHLRPCFRLPFLDCLGQPCFCTLGLFLHLDATGFCFGYATSILISVLSLLIWIQEHFF